MRFDRSDPRARTSVKRIAKWIADHRELAAAVAGFAILMLAFAALSDLLHELKGSDIRRSLATIPVGRWLIAAAFTCGSFLCLTFYDAFALKVIGAKMPYPVTARAGASSYAISNMLGLSLLTGGSVRLRIYGRAGLSGDDVARVVALAAATFWSGVFVLFAFAIVLSPGQIAVGGLVVPAIARWLVAVAIFGAVCGYLLWTARVPREFRAGKVTLPCPAPPPRSARSLWRRRTSVCRRACSSRSCLKCPTPSIRSSWRPTSWRSALPC